MASTTCTHLGSIQILEGPEPDELDGCETCLVEGTKWLHLRMCMTCGVVGCCDDSPGQHARKHADAESHPVVRSIEPGESWSYCFVDDVVFNVAGTNVQKAVEPPHTFNDDPGAGRIDMWVGSDRVGWIDYGVVGDSINLTHTEVVAGKQGLGYGGELVREAIRVFGAQNKPLIPSCEFARSFIAKRPGLHGAVAARMRSRLLGEEA